MWIPPSCVSVWLLGPCFKTGEGTPDSVLRQWVHGESRPHSFWCCTTMTYLHPSHRSLLSALVSISVSKLPEHRIEDAWRLVLAISRLQVPCHSLSKGFFNFVLMLLVVRTVWPLGFWLNGLTPSMSQHSHEGLWWAGGLLGTSNFASPEPNRLLLKKVQPS